MSEFVVTGSADSDSDGLPDDFELSNNLNPSDPSDAREDPDRDGLNNLDEFRQGTNLRNPDTDGDGLRDGEEIVRGTNPLLADTDGDLIPDGLEIQLGTNPLDPRSGSLAQALSRLEVTPIAPTLVVNTLSPEASAQLRVTGVLLDNSRVDLTSTVRGTRYTSSNLTICNFGAIPGQVFAGEAGSCVVTVTNNSFTAQVPVRVENFNPTVRSQLYLADAVALDLFQSYVVAVGGSTLRMVNVSNRSNPAVAGTVTAPGANLVDVRVSGSLAYAAGGVGGLYIFNIANPGTPQLVRTIDTPGSAEDIAVVPNQRLYLADGANGLLIYDLSGDPTNPQLRSTTSVGSPVHGVAVDAQRNLAVLALHANGLRVVDVSNPNAPVLRGALAGGDVRDVEIRGNAALLADLSFRSFTSVDISNPSAPVLSRSLPAQFGGLLFDIGLAGDFAFGADIFFVNDTPVIDITDPLNPVARFIFRFPGDATGTGVKADAAFVYLLSDGNLSIGQYRAITDNNGIPPTVSIVNPMPGSTVIARTTVPVTIQAVDDVAVAAVQLLVNGQVVGTATGAPYTIGLPVPAGVTSITFQARAVDLGGNVGVSPEAGYNVIVGPLTTVTGSGVDRQNNPVANARMNVINEFYGQSGADGHYSIANVPSVLQRVRAYGEVAVNNVVLRGRSGWANTVPNGATDVGQMIYFPDADWDGLPDDFESQHACLLPNSADDENDPDGDGLGNLREYELNTDPCRPNLPPGRNHAVSAIISLRNGPETSGRANNNLSVSGLPTIRWSSPVLKVASSSQQVAAVRADPQQAQAGETLRLVYDPGGVTPAEVEFRINGVSLSRVIEPPFETAFVLPQGSDEIRVRAIAYSADGTAVHSVDHRVQVFGNPEATIAFTLIDELAKPLEDHSVTAMLAGLKAEFFDFDTPLFEIPDLSARTPDRVVRVSSLSYRNPVGIFGADLFGPRMAPDYAVRFRGYLEILELGDYRLRLSSLNGARLEIDGEPVVTIADGIARAQESDVRRVFGPGLHKIELVYYATIGAPELVLSIANGNGPLRAVDSGRLWHEEPLVTNNAGEVTISDVPTWLDGVRFVIGGGSRRVGVSAKGSSQVVMKETIE